MPEVPTHSADLLSNQPVGPPPESLRAPTPPPPSPTPVSPTPPPVPQGSPQPAPVVEPTAAVEEPQTAAVEIASAAVGVMSGGAPLTPLEEFMSLHLRMGHIAKVFPELLILLISNTEWYIDSYRYLTCFCWT